MDNLPETQLDAFHTIKNKDAKQMLVFEVIKKNGGVTLFELVKFLKWPINRISGRVSELVKMGMVVDSGRRKQNPESNKSGIVWVAT